MSHMNESYLCFFYFFSLLWFLSYYLKHLRRLLSKGQWYQHLKMISGQSEATNRSTNEKWTFHGNSTNQKSFLNIPVLHRRLYTRLRSLYSAKLVADWLLWAVGFTNVTIKKTNFQTDFIFSKISEIRKYSREIFNSTKFSSNTFFQNA